MFQTKAVQRMKTHILCPKAFFFFFEIRAVYEIMWRNAVELIRLQKKASYGGMPNACWISKTTNTHSEYVIHIAFLLQQWFHERALLLRYTYIASLVNIYSSI